MSLAGPAIQLCKAGEYVCQRVILFCQISGSLRLTADELKKSLFVGF